MLTAGPSKPTQLSITATIFFSLDVQSSWGLLSFNLPDIAIVSITAYSLLFSPQAKAQAGSWCLLICFWLLAVPGWAVDSLSFPFVYVQNLERYLACDKDTMWWKVGR